MPKYRKVPSKTVEPKAGPMHPYVKMAAVNMMSWSIPALCTAYGWPTKLAGGGIIGIGELGGGWLPSDMAVFFKSIGQPVPTIVDISVDGAKNDPGKSGADVEVTLDIQVAAAAYFVATGKPATIRMYWAKNTASAMPKVTKKAADDGCDVLSWSWGADEADWGKAGVLAMEAAALYATNKGTVVLAASGDNDSKDGGSAPANVDCPASCPHVIGTGGTMKTLHAETVWNQNPGNADGEGTGGGYSMYFPMPSWQAGAPHGPGRMVPDVAGNADPRTGYQIYVGGKHGVVGGTSAVAPLWAGLLAASGKKLAFITPKLFLNHLAFNDITSGDNGMYRARPGADPCTGLGSPYGGKVAALFASK